jgi:PAS domain S-box-containing protein
VKGVPDFDESGGVRGMYVVAHDITEVKEAEALLAAREQDLRFFAENIPEAIVYIDLERGCTFVNNVFLATRGFTRAEALGKFPDQVYPREVMETLQPHIERAISGEESAYERLCPRTRGGAVDPRAHLPAPRGRQGRRLLRGLDRHRRDQARPGGRRGQGTPAAPGDRLDPDADGVLRRRPPLPLRERRVPRVRRLPAERVVGRTVREIFGEDRWRAFEPISSA